MNAASVSIILPSYLSTYPNCAKNRIAKFRRAVDSFLKQTYPQKLMELVIIADGCGLTAQTYRKFYAKHQNIKFKQIQKQPLFSGNVRQAGIEMATGDVLMYLDGDDELTTSHVESVMVGFQQDDPDLVYWSDWVRTLKGESSYAVRLPNERRQIVESRRRPVALVKGGIGTSCIAHKRAMNLSWSGCDGYGHDWTFIQRALKTSGHRKEIYGTGYIVCHIAGKIDL